MRTSRYSEIARSAAMHEKCGSLIQAAKLWRLKELLSNLVYGDQATFRSDAS